MNNTLFYGDNLEILQERLHLMRGNIDLIYVDPPLPNERRFGVPFLREEDPSKRTSMAVYGLHRVSFDEQIYDWRVIEGVNKVTAAIEATSSRYYGPEVAEYFLAMSRRFIEFREVLKDTGMLFVHCDSISSHYFRLLLDVIFGADMLRNVIVWYRRWGSSVRSHYSMKQLANSHDVVLLYAKTKLSLLNSARLQDDPVVQERYPLVASDGRRYRLVDLTRPKSSPRTTLDFEFLGITAQWRHTQARMEELYRRGEIVEVKPGILREKVYYEQSSGMTFTDVWEDVSPIRSLASERTGYPTQKPLALLERIVQLGSKPDDLVLDPFTGTGTTLVAAEKLGRKWIGIDSTFLAISLAKQRLIATRGDAHFEIEGTPRDLDSARRLAVADPREFTWWALSLVGATPVQKSDASAPNFVLADGFLTFRDEASKVPATILIEVKTGHLAPAAIRQVIQQLQKSKAAMALLITLEEPPADVLAAVESVGRFVSTSGEDFPRVQVYSINSLLQGAEPKTPVASTHVGG